MQPASLPARADVRFGMLDGLLDVGIAFTDAPPSADTLVQSTGSVATGEMSTASPERREKPRLSQPERSPDAARHQPTKVTMSTMSNERATSGISAALVDLRLEVVVIPVSDVDRAKRFYENLGWRLDADFTNGVDWRGVQMTPPGSPCSIHFGKGLTTAAPGSIKNLYLVVSDIEAARNELIGRGVEISGAFHFAALGGPPVPGVAPDGRSYATYATFSDPDGNSWLLQEVKSRLAGRGLGIDVATLTDLLREAEEFHGAYERSAPKHHWSNWYAAYIVARERGEASGDAAKTAAIHVEGTRR
jgi:catechol 2,3-dioxygenase-like lactoylglutathione lyase family enzyme